jgi:hypothetical protein
MVALVPIASHLGVREAYKLLQKSKTYARCSDGPDMGPGLVILSRMETWQKVEAIVLFETQCDMRG